MEYKGKLYGKVGKSYFPLIETAEDFENLKVANDLNENACRIYKHKFEEAIKMLEYIRDMKVNPFDKCVEELIEQLTE